VPPATKAASAAGVVPPVAIILWHGMGQQIPFETIETVIRGITGSLRSQPDVETRFVKFGDDGLWRAEFDYETKDGRAIRVHIYEVYWAPLTEGKITIRETLSFLFRAGLTGLRYVFSGDFRRHLFGRWVSFPTSAGTALQLAALLLTLAAMVVLNSAIATAASVTLLTGGTNRWPSYPLLGDLTADLLVYELTMGGMLFALWLAWRLQTPRRAKGRPSTRGSWLKWPLWAAVVGAMAATVAAGVFVLSHFWRHHTADRVMAWRWPGWLVGAVYGYTPFSFDILLRIASIWTIALLVSSVVRSFLVQYVGDVAIYVASHKLNRFYEARQAIKKESRRVVSAIYRYGGYARHIAVGHSLGSVVAYDAINRLLNESSAELALDVRARTRALLTFGSPLDKTAFLFRAQSEFSDVREAMAAAAQPLITSYSNRPIWINIYADGDAIGGRLDYYDAPIAKPSATAPGGAVFNLRDEEAWIPIVAHTQYWTNRTFVGALRALLEDESV
jgi:hypothetical protein